MRLYTMLTALSIGALLALPGLGTARTAATQDPGGEKIFRGKGNCFTCHGPAGKGTPLAPDLTDDVWLEFEGTPARADIEDLVRRGVPQPVRHPAPMPAMGGARLSDDEITAVAEYVLSLSGAPDA